MGGHRVRTGFREAELVRQRQAVGQNSGTASLKAQGRRRGSGPEALRGQWRETQLRMWGPGPGDAAADDGTALWRAPAGPFLGQLH